MDLVTSLSLRFSLLKLLKKIQLTFWCNRQQAHQNIRNNRSFGEQNTYLFQNIFLFQNIPNERALNI